MQKEMDVSATITQRPLKFLPANKKQQGGQF
jgi:hypothetical protein